MNTIIRLVLFIGGAGGHFYRELEPGKILQDIYWIWAIHSAHIDKHAHCTVAARSQPVSIKSVPVLAESPSRKKSTSIGWYSSKQDTTLQVELGICEISSGEQLCFFLPFLDSEMTRSTKGRLELRLVSPHLENIPRFSKFDF